MRNQSYRTGRRRDSASCVGRRRQFAWASGAFLFSLFVWAGAAAQSTDVSGWHFPPPGHNIKLHDPRKAQDVGMDAAFVEQINRHLAEHPYTRVKVVPRWALWRHGRLVHVEGNFYQTVDVASLRKTWHAMIVGAAIQQGRIPSLDQKISVWLPELKGLHAEATWRHVITQSAGLDYPYGNYPAYRPGEMWTYSDWNPSRLCGALAHVYGRKDFHDYYELVAKRAYFDAIGMEGWSTRIVNAGRNFEQGDGVRFVLSLEHMGRLGLLALAGGRWGGQQLVPEWFVRELETKQTGGMKVNYNGPNDGIVGLDPERFKECPYGYMTWVNTDGNWFPGADRAWAWASGAGGTQTLWNRNNGIVFAGAGIEMSPSSHSIPHIIEQCVTGSDPLVGVSTLAPAGKIGADASAPTSAPPKSVYLPGQIIIHPANRAYLAYNRDADKDGQPDPFFLCGPGGPEGFLYGDISGDLSQDQLLDQIIQYGGNSIYVMGIRSHGGDGKPEHNPFVGHDPSKGLDPKILDQWEKWFRRMEQHGIVIYFFFYDDSVKLWRGDNIGPEERNYIRGIVDRFKHHHNLIWCIAEEYSEALSREKVRKLAAKIRSADDHAHIIAVHQHSGTRFDFPGQPNIEQFAMQIGADSVAAVHDRCLESRTLAGGRFNVIMAELSPYHSDLLVEGDRDGVRKVNWAAAIAGLGVMHLGTWETADKRNPPTVEMLQDYRRLQRFFESIPDLPDMKPMDDKVRSGAAWVLGKTGHHLAYLPQGGRIELDLSGEKGPMQAQWYDPREGTVAKTAKTEAGRIESFQAPDQQDWVLNLATLDR